MFSFKNRVVLYGAIRPIEYYATVEAHKKPVVRKEKFLVSIGYKVIPVNL